MMHYSAITKFQLQLPSSTCVTHVTLYTTKHASVTELAPYVQLLYERSVKVLSYMHQVVTW